MMKLNIGLPVVAAFWVWTTAISAAELKPELELARQLNRAFADVAERVSPAVVVINVLQKTRPPDDTEQDDGSFDSLPPGFWRRFHEQFKRDQPETTRGQGSGIILRTNGYILTNRHVVEDAESIEVQLKDGRTFKATVQGVDPQSDLAVVRIAARDLPVCAFGDSAKTRVGEFAIAIGAPFSLDYSVTFGHISAKARSNVIESYEGATMDQDFLQTDALINPGNSGGPLVNIEGEVIGVNTLIRGLHTGIGFAIPSNLAREVAEQLIATGKFTRPWLGIGIRALHDLPDLQALLKGLSEGVVVSQIIPGSPAAKSDLKPTDVITAVDGSKVNTPQELRTVIRAKRIGQPVTLEVVRSGKKMQVSLSPGEAKEPPTLLARSTETKPAPAADAPSLGITVQTLSKELAARFGVAESQGVLVASVEKDSAAARKGLKAGDVITSVDQQNVTNPKQFRELVKKTDLKRGVLLNLVSDNTARFEILKEPEP